MSAESAGADAGAIEFFRAVLATIDPAERPLVWAAAADALAVELLKETGPGRAAAVDRALRLYRRALRLRRRHDTPESVAISEYNLANAYGRRLRGDPSASAERAIRLYERALRVRTREGSPREWRWTMHNLAVAWRTRPGGDPSANADRAIALGEEVLASLDGSEEPGFRLDVLHNLAIAWRTRPHGVAAENVERAVALFEDVLEGTPPGDRVGWARACTALANALQVRVHGDRAENMERAIGLYRQALRVRTRAAHPDEWAMTLNNLAVLFRQRVHGREDQNLDRAMHLLRRSLRVRTREAGPVEWARTMSNLGNVLQDRKRGDRARNLERAIQAYEQALEVQRLETLPVDWAKTANNLAACYSIRRLGDRAENLRRAVDLLTATLRVRRRDTLPLGWAEAHDNLGRVHERALQAGVATDPAPAVAAYRAALEVLRPDLLPTDCREVARRLGRLLGRTGGWSAAADAYALAMESAEALHRQALLPAGRDAVLASTPALYHEAGYALLRDGRTREAAVALERGRARALGDALARDRADLSRLERAHPELHTPWLAAAAAVRAVEREARTLRARFTTGGFTATGELRERAERARAALDEVVGRISALPGFADFMGSAGFAGIEAAVMPGTPLVYLAATEWGSAALVLHRRAAADEVRCTPVFEDELTSARLDALLGAGGGEGYALAQAGDLDALRDALPAVLRGVQPVVAAVARALAEAGAESVVLLPGGRFAMLPLHAVRTAPRGRPLGERYAVSYAPSARVLAAARRRAAAGAEPSLFAVADPAGDWEPLECAADEVASARAWFPPGAVALAAGEDATSRAVREGVRRASYLHFACHAVFDDDDPLASYLLLAGGERLTLEEVLATPVDGARLVVLSACQTAVHESRRLPDEAVGLAAGFLQAGAAGVVATLWPVDDLATSLLVGRFYRNLFEAGQTPPAALAAAQRWLRQASDEELAGTLERLPTLRRLRALHPRGSRTRGARDPSAAFAAPYDWAGFVYVGA